MVVGYPWIHPLMIASQNCYRLARFLHASMRKIPYEDVRIAATQLLQCAPNVLTVRFDVII